MKKLLRNLCKLCLEMTERHGVVTAFEFVVVFEYYCMILQEFENIMDPIPARFCSYFEWYRISVDKKVWIVMIEPFERSLL